MVHLGEEYNKLSFLEYINKCKGVSKLYKLTYQMGIHDDIPGHVHGVLKIPLDLHEDVLAGSPQKDGAGLGALALGEEGEVFISELLDLKERRVRFRREQGSIFLTKRLKIVL